VTEEVGSDERLAVRTLGESGPRVVFVHGLFGQGKNWTTIAKGLADGTGSPWSTCPTTGTRRGPTGSTTSTWPRCSPPSWSTLGEPVTLVGHSMGGKVAMQLALRRPELLRALVVVDIAPVEYPVRRPHRRPGRGGLALRRLHRGHEGPRPGRAETREDADAALRSAVPSRMVRSFLLQSLVRGRESAPAAAGAGG
jgi:pimeloyl-ACP methyl ester carboxylesterase